MTNSKSIGGNNSICPPAESLHVMMEGQRPALSSSPGAFISRLEVYLFVVGVY